jgi:hypothetical protein
MRADKRTESLADWLNVALGAWLFLTPWLLGYASTRVASWNAWLCGLAIAALAAKALVDFAEWEEWMNVILGLWVAASPWFVETLHEPLPQTMHLVLGLGVVATAAVHLWMIRRHPPRVRA